MSLGRRSGAFRSLGPACVAGLASLLGCGGAEEAEAGAAGALSCELEGPIGVQLGEGGDVSIPMDATRPPTAQLGAQGALFVQVSVRVAPPLVFQPELQLELRARRAVGCAGPECEWSPIGRWMQRVDPASQTSTDGAVDIVGVVLVVSTWNPSEAREIAATVTDRCARSGSASVVFAPQ